jgi:hypothetical protein
MSLRLLHDGEVLKAIAANGSRNAIVKALGRHHWWPIGRKVARLMERGFIEQACCCGCAPLRPTEKGREHLRRLTGEAP